MLLYYLSRIEDAREHPKFEQLYYAYRYLMRHVAIEILGDAALAEDAVHEAFVRIAQNLHKIEDPLSQKTKNFVVIIARNQAINLYNKQKGRKEVLWEDWAQQEDSAPAPDTHGENVVLVCLRRLPELYAQAMLLKFVHGLSDKECAGALKISPEALRKRIERGRRLLALELEKEGVGGYV